MYKRQMQAWHSALLQETGLTLLQGGCPELGPQAQLLDILGDMKRRAEKADVEGLEDAVGLGGPP